MIYGHEGCGLEASCCMGPLDHTPRARKSRNELEPLASAKIKRCSAQLDVPPPSAAHTLLEGVHRTLTPRSSRHTALHV